MKWALATLLSIIGMAGGIGWYLGYFPNHVDDLKFVAVEPLRAANDRRNLRLVFRSDQNLRALANRSGAYGLWARFGFCPWRANPSISIGRVEHNGVDLDLSPAIEDTPQVRAEVASALNTKGSFFYEVRFIYREQWVEYKAEYGGTTQRRYPLPSSFRDICVKIDGYGDPPGLVGNIVRIPKIALEKALGTSRPEPLDQKKWSDNQSELTCEPHSFTRSQRLILKLAPKHGPNLAVHRIADNTWWVIISNEAPAHDHSLMTERVFSETRNLDLNSDITGFQWWAAKSPQQRIFTRTGDYLIYVPPPGTENLESNKPGFGCVVRYTNN